VGEGVDDDWVGRTVAAHVGFANGGYALAAGRTVGKAVLET
jgi:hypothetical protein